VQKIVGRNLEKSNAKRCKMTCRVELDVEPLAVESNSTLDLKGLSYSVHDLPPTACSTLVTGCSDYECGS
jgi:hypothetical protein